MQIRLMLSLIVTFSLFACHSNEQSNAEKPDQKTDNENTMATDSLMTQNILFFGNSLTAGYGLASQEEAFPALIQQKIDSLGLPYKAINAGLSGETSAGGKERIDWLLKQPFAVFVLELGANDGLRGIPTETTYKNLTDIVKKVKAKNPNCQLLLAGMLVPPSMGEAYGKKFENIFPRLAKAQQMALIPFLLAGVGGVAELNQEDGIHPTAAGQKILAENVWKVLKPKLQ